MAFSCNVFLTFLSPSAAECLLFEAFLDRRFPEMVAKVTILLRTSLEKTKNTLSDIDILLKYGTIDQNRFSGFILLPGSVL